MTNHLIEHLRSNAATNQPGKDWLSPLSGWLLSTLVALEEDCGGTLLFAYKAGPLWRNAVAVAVVATDAIAAKAVQTRPGPLKALQTQELTPWPPAPKLQPGTR